MSRLLAIGDVHGCFHALTTLWKTVDISSEDTVVMLGDYVDRGPNSRDVVQWLIDHHRTHSIIALRGNHEVMMLAAKSSSDQLRRWCKFGGSEALASYTNDPDGIGCVNDVPAAHWNFLQNELQRFHETDQHIFVHGIVHPHQPMQAQSDSMLFWEAYWPKFPGHQSGKTVICGHKSQKSGMPLSNGKAICIDTAACKGGWLSCLDVSSGEIWQASEHGATRMLSLEHLRPI